jgi:RNase P subunit RPR2
MKPKKADVRQEAREQAAHLLEMARAMWPKDENLARRYVHLARQLAMRHRVHLDPRAYCKACGVPFCAGTLKVRQERANQTVLYACRQCNALRRIPYLRKTNVPPKAGLNRQPGSTKSDAKKKHSMHKE